jgi:chorismate dehydratase
MKKVRTADGSLTFLSERYGEPYHSLTAGAFTEAVEKFCKPCMVREKAKSGEVNLLDICFGLGYNSVSFIDEVLKSNPKARVFILSIEKDVSAAKRAIHFDWGKYSIYKPLLKELFSRMYVFKGFANFIYSDGKVGIRLVVGDVRRVMKRFCRDYREFFDAVFHDPFSPKVNPEMWTFELFSLVGRFMKGDGILATYSASSSVRKALLMAGFGVREGVAIGRRSRSTIASFLFKTEEKLLKKVVKSVPFRDPHLEDLPELISSRRKGCQYILSKDYVQPECLRLN